MWATAAKFVGKMALSIATMMAMRKVVNIVEEGIEKKTTCRKSVNKQEERQMHVHEEQICLPESDFKVI